MTIAGRGGAAASWVPPAPTAYADFLHQVRAVLGERYGDSWLTNNSDGSQTLNIGVVREQASDGPTIGSLAGAYSGNVRLVSVAYSLAQLQKFQSEISEAIFPRVAGPSTSPAAFQYEGVNHYVMSIGIDSPNNKVLVRTGGTVDSGSLSPAQRPATIPTDIPTSAYSVDTSDPVRIVAGPYPQATPSDNASAP